MPITFKFLISNVMQCQITGTVVDALPPTTSHVMPCQALPSNNPCTPHFKYQFSIPENLQKSVITVNLVFGPTY